MKAGGGGGGGGGGVIFVTFIEFLLPSLATLTSFHIVVVMTKFVLLR